MSLFSIMAIPALNVATGTVTVEHTVIDVRTLPGALQFAGNFGRICPVALAQRDSGPVL
ncbi:MAG TPA: hypothetical protein VMN60_02315 [Longimicrobiales bacterium]|nr:hypothetical protein [Longimicrobiales bacterium]